MVDVFINTLRPLDISRAGTAETEKTEISKKGSRNWTRTSLRGRIQTPG